PYTAVVAVYHETPLDGTPSLSMEVPVTVTESPLSRKDAYPVGATEGEEFSGPLFTFTDPANEPAASYTAAIDWGDGATTDGTVSQLGNGTYAVTGSHTYGEEGYYPVTGTIRDDAGSPGGPALDMDTQATVADTPLLLVPAANLALVEGQAF